MIDVRAFGIIGNGETDNYSALTVLLEYINSLGGGQVFFPPGIYIANGYLPLYNNLHFLGVMGQSVIKQIDYNTDMFRNLTGPASNITFENMVLEGVSPGVNESTRCLIRIYGYDEGYNENINIFNCLFKSDLKAVVGMKISGANIHNNLFSPISGGGPACHIVKGGEDPTLSENIKIHDNRFESFGVGETLSGSPGYTYMQPIGCEASNLEVYNNTIEGWTYNGITAEITKAENISIHDNTIKATIGHNNSGSGILVRPRKDIFICDNNITGKSESDNGVSITLNSNDLPAVSSVFDGVYVKDNTINNANNGVVIFGESLWTGTPYPLKDTAVIGNIFSGIINAEILCKATGFDNSGLTLNINGNITHDPDGYSNISIASGGTIAFTDNDSMGLSADGPVDSTLAISGNIGAKGDSIHAATFSNFAGNIIDNQSSIMYGPEIDLSDPANTYVCGVLDSNNSYIFSDYGVIYTEETDSNPVVRIDAKITKKDGTTIAIKNMTTEVNKPIYSKSLAGSSGKFDTSEDYTGVAFYSAGNKIGTGKVKPYIKLIKVR